MAKLIDITGKPISGEWGDDDPSGVGFPVLRTTNFTNEGIVNYSNVVTRQIHKKNLSEKFLRFGDIILEKSGGSDKQPVGRVVFFEGEENKYLFNNFTGLLRIADTEKWIPKYVFYALFANYNSGGTLPYENRTTGLHNLQTGSFIAETEIPERSNAEQIKIVSYLDKISNLIAIRRAQLEKLDELVKSRFVEMFGNPVYNTKGLPTKKLAELGDIDRGRSQHRPRNAPELLNGPYPLIQTGEVAAAGLYITEYHNTYSELGLAQSKMWKAGTLCITIAANIAQTAILTFEACFPDSVVGFVSNGSVSAIYMHYWFGFFQKILEEQAPQVAQKNINLKILSELDVMLPDLEKQAMFATVVEQTEKTKLTIRQSLDKLTVMKQSLMQQYFG